jgi:hypothetical protein
MDGGEQPFDLLLIGVGTLIRQKRIHFFDGWRQTDQVQTGAPQQRNPIRFG